MHTVDYHELFQALPERYFAFDTTTPDYVMFAASDSYLQVTGKTTDQIIGKKLFDVFPDTSERAKKTGRGDLHDSFDKVIKTLKPDSTGVIRYDVTNSDGVMELRYWQATHYPIIREGKCVAIVQSTMDVTDLMKSNDELKLANLKLEDAMTAGLVGSWIWDVNDNVLQADAGLANMFGVKEDEALSGLPLETFVASIHKDDRDEVVKAIEATVDHKNTFEMEYRVVDAKGNVRWVIARGSVERDKKGKAIKFPGVMIDISSRKNAEAELRESEERLRFMADTMPQLVWITRPDGYHEYYNKQWYAYTGTKLGTTDGEGWNNLFHEDDQKRAWKVWRHSLKTGEPYEIKYRLYHAPSKTYRWVIGRALPYRNEANEIVKWYGTCTDIDDSIQELEKRKALEAELQAEKERLESRVAERTSQLKLMNEGLLDEIKKRQDVEEKLREYGKELERSNGELEEFAYVSSHDLQEPLRKIQAFSDLLVEEYGDKLGGGDMYLDRIRKSASRMSRLIEDLLTFSRVTTKQAVPDNIDLNETMENVIADLHDRIKKERGEVVVKGTLPTVCSDATHMHQLFQNLVGNALKFHDAERPPKVTVSAKTTKKTHTICVQDNGIGIDEKYKEKIFAVFQRLNSKHAYEGTGIGLAVCKKIVERYGGTIDIESELGSGTTFIITLPNEDPHA